MLIKTYYRAARHCRSVAECSRQDDEFRRRRFAEAERDALEPSVIASSQTTQRSLSADRQQLQTPRYDTWAVRRSHRHCYVGAIESDYRQMSRCWYDLAVARAAAAIGNRTQQQRVVSVSDQPSTDFETISRSPHPQVIDANFRPVSAVDDVTGSRITSSESRFRRDVAVCAGDVESGGTMSNVNGNGSAGQSDGRSVAGVRDRTRTASVEMSVPRRCRSVSRTRRRALSTEMTLTRTTTTTETTTITSSQRHQQQQQDDARRCLATDVTVDTSHVVIYDSDAVAIDNDDSSTLVADVFDDLSSLSADEVSGSGQRDDVTVTSHGCDDGTVDTSPVVSYDSDAVAVDNDDSSTLVTDVDDLSSLSTDNASDVRVHVGQRDDVIVASHGCDNVTVDMSPVVSYDGDAVAIDNDDSSTLAADVVNDLSSLSTDEVSVMGQRDDVIVTSRRCEDVTLVMIESSSGDVTTDVAVKALEMDHDSRLTVDDVRGVDVDEKKTAESVTTRGDAGFEVYQSARGVCTSSQLLREHELVYHTNTTDTEFNKFGSVERTENAAESAAGAEVDRNISSSSTSNQPVPSSEVAPEIEDTRLSTAVDDRALSIEMKLNRTTTTTESTVIISPQRQQQQQQRDDDIWRCLATAITVDSYDSDAVAIDNNDSSTLVTDIDDLSLLSTDDASDVRDDVVQRDDLTLTSHGWYAVIESAGGDVTTGVVPDDNDMAESDVNPATGDTCESATARHAGGNLASCVVCDDNTPPAERTSDQTVDDSADKRAHVAWVISSCLLVDKKHLVREELTAVDDVLPPIDTVTASRTDDDSTMTAGDVWRGVIDADEEKIVDLLTADDDTACESNRLAYDVCTGDCHVQTTSAEQVRELVRAVKTGVVVLINDGAAYADELADVAQVDNDISCSSSSKQSVQSSEVSPETEDTRLPTTVDDGAFSIEVKLNKATTTTQTTTITPPQRQQQQLDDDIWRCLATTVTVDTSPVVSYYGDAVAIDNDGSSTLVADVVDELSSLSTDEVSGVTNDVEQRDDVTVTSHGCDDVTMDTSQVVSYDSDAVAIDNDDSSTLVASVVYDLSSLFTDEVFDVADSTGPYDSVTVTSDGCDDELGSSDVTTDVAVTALETGDDSKVTVDDAGCRFDDEDEENRIESPTAVGATVDEFDRSLSNIQATSVQQPRELVCSMNTTDVEDASDRLVERPENADVMQAESTSKQQSLTIGYVAEVREEMLTDTEQVGDEPAQGTDADACPHVHRHQIHVEASDGQQLAAVSSEVDDITDIVEQRDDVTVTSDRCDYVKHAVMMSVSGDATTDVGITELEPEDDSRMTVDDVGRRVDEDERAGSLTADSDEVDEFSDGQATLTQQLRELLCSMKSADVDESSDSSVECDGNANEDVADNAGSVSMSQNGDVAAVREDAWRMVVVEDVSDMEDVGSELTQDTDPRRADCPHVQRQQLHADVSDGQQMAPVCSEVPDVMAVERHVTSFVVLQLGETEETSEWPEVTQTRGETWYQLAARAEDRATSSLVGDDDIADDDVMAVELECGRPRDVAALALSYWHSAEVANDAVDVGPCETGSVPTTLVATDCDAAATVDDVIQLPVGVRHSTNVVMLELEQAEETSDSPEVVETRSETIYRVARLADDTPNEATSSPDGVVSTDDVRLLHRTGVSPKSDSASVSDDQQLTVGCIQRLCLHIYDDSHLSTTDFGPSETSDQAGFYVDHWNMKTGELREVFVGAEASSSCSVEVATAMALFDEGFERDPCTSVQSKELQTDVALEIFDECVTVSTVSLISDDSVAVVKSSTCDATGRSDAEVRSLTEKPRESTDSRVRCAESGREEMHTDGRLVVHDYGEMWSIFREIPLWVEVLRAEVIERHNADPRISRLLLRYPSLRPGTWMWTSPPAVRDERPSSPSDESESRTTTYRPRAVTDCWSYDVVPVIETCTLVTSVSRDVID